MKNKKVEQIAARQKHRELLMNQRRAYPVLERPIPSLTTKPTILIVCEGENTEPSYFNQFRLSSAKVKSVGEGYNTISLVIRAFELSQKEKYDQVWCVFDKDDFSDQDFNQAIEMAENYNFGVAYSNQAFEYWLILHINDHQAGGMHRNDYNIKLNNLLKPYNVRFDGNGSKVVDEDFFDHLFGMDEITKKRRVDLAIVRAERNYTKFDHINPAKEESSTTVFRLVQELLKHV